MRENAHLSLSPINRWPHITQKKKPPQVSPRRLSLEGLFVGVGADTGIDGTVIAGIFLFGESMALLRLGSVALIVVGLIGLKLSH